MSETTLVFDTTNRWIVLGLYQDGPAGGEPTIALERRIDAAREASMRLIPEIKSMLAEAGIAKPDRIICTLGPGSFTGARICVGTGRNLSQLWNIPVFGLDSLLYYCYDIAMGLDKKDLTNIAVLMDGKQRRVYARLIDPNRGFAHYHEQTAALEGSTGNNRPEENQDGGIAGLEGLQDIAPLEFFQALDSGVKTLVFADDPSAIQDYMEKDPRNNEGSLRADGDFPEPRAMVAPGARTLYELGLLLGAREAQSDWRELSPIYLRRDPATAKYPRGYNKAPPGAQ